MVIFTGDSNRTCLIGESGTYGNPSGVGVWIGLVSDHSPEESMGVMSMRYQGANTRDIAIHVDGPQDYTGTLTYNPQDWRILAYTLGSTVVTGSPYVYTIKASETGEGNPYTSGTKAPFISFTLEDTKLHALGASGLHMIRTYNGCMVDSLSISATQGEVITCEVGYIAQVMTMGSVNPTAVTASTLRPYIWSDSKVMIPSGTIYEEMTGWTVDINNNIQPTHYCNGSRIIAIPLPTTRDYAVTLNYQANSQKSKTLYDQYFLGGSEFNMLIPVNASSTQQMFLTMSGCKLTEMTTPGAVEDITEQTLTIIPKKITATATESIATYTIW